MNTTQQHQTAQTDDVDVLADQVRDIIKGDIEVVKSHFEKTGLKCSCQVTVEFSEKDDELVIKLVPKRNLPLETTELTGEIDSQGNLKII